MRSWGRAVGRWSWCGCAGFRHGIGLCWRFGQSVPTNKSNFTDWDIWRPGYFQAELVNAGLATGYDFLKLVFIHTKGRFSEQL